MSQQCTSALHKEDVVVVPSQGLCRVIKVEEKELYGVHDTYFTFQPYQHSSDSNGTITLPVSQLTKQGVRWPADRVSIIKALRLLQHKRKIFRGNYTRRSTFFHGLLNSSQLSELAACVRDSWYKDEVEPAHFYITMFELALQRLALEVAYVYDEPYQVVCGKLESIVGNRTPPEDFFPET